MAMTSGKADPQKLYFGGKLKVSGNVMASQKLNFLTKIDPKEVAAAPKADAPKADAPKAEGSRAGCRPRRPPSSRRCRSGWRRAPSWPPRSTRCSSSSSPRPRAPGWWICARLPAPCPRAAQAGATATLTLADEDLLALAKGTAARELFQRSKLRVDGDVRAAHRLGFLKNLI